jgi:hemerythrin-like metal-binding protein
MGLVLWDRSLSVGVEVLDADHITIISLINHIDDAKQHGSDEDAVAAIVGTLIRFAVHHFRREEDMLAAVAYPDLQRHIEQHRLLEDQLAELHEAYAQTSDPDISQEIMELLHFWIVEHILRVDMPYKSFLDHDTNTTK